MRNVAKILPLIVLAAIVVGIGIAIGWLGSKGPEVDPNEAVVDPPLRPLPGQVTTSSVRLNPNLAATQNVVSGQGQNTVPPVTPTMANAMTNWEDMLDDVLAADDDDTNKVTELFGMYPTLNEEGQVEVAQHLANLVPDEEYTPLARLLENPETREDVLEILLSDVLNRPNATKLPVLLNVARTPNHPKASEAKDLLELFLDEDYGDNWVTWEQKMTEWLANNPD